jgi:hypothetical protein
MSISFMGSPSVMRVYPLQPPPPFFGPPLVAAVGGGGGGAAFMPVSADWMPARTR